MDELNGEVTEEEEEQEEGEGTWAEVLVAAAAPLPSTFLERKARGLERKQEARTESEELGESARPGDRCGATPSYRADLLDAGYTSLRRHSGAISLSTSTLQTVCRRARRRDLWIRGINCAAAAAACEALCGCGV